MSYNPYQNNPYQQHPTPPPVEISVEKEKNKGVIIGAIITGTFVILGAIITGIFGLIHLNSSGSNPGSTPVPPTAVVAQFPNTTLLVSPRTKSFELFGFNEP
jgi:hypothetical protein